MDPHTAAIPGRRRTWQRSAVLEALNDQGGFASAKTLHDAIRSAGSRIGLATVYRTLQALADSGLADVVLAGDGESLYRRCDADSHHHHIVCNSCGAAVEVADEHVERWASRTASQHGFTDVTHRIEVFGTCPTCARRRVRSARRAR